MKLAWVGLVFHAVMILWLERNGLPANKKSKPCTSAGRPPRLLVVIMPDLRREHMTIFRDYRTGIVGNVKPTGHTCPPVISYFSGVVTKPLFPNSLDTIFDHVSATVYAGRELFPIDKFLIKVHKPVYLNERRWRDTIRTEIDGFAGFMWSRNGSHGKEKLFHARSTLFLLNLSGLKSVNSSMSSVRSVYFDIAQMAKSLDYLYRDNGTNVLILGDKGGPFALWGPNVYDSPGFPVIAPSDVAPLIAGLLRIAVPHDSVGLISTTFIKRSRDGAAALVCNALQLHALVEQKIQGPLMADLRGMHNNSLLGVNWLEKAATRKSWDSRASKYGSGLLWFLRCIYIGATLRLDKIAMGMIIAGIASWLFLLVVELTSISHKHVHEFSWLIVSMHVVFGVAAMVLSTLPVIFDWPYTYYVFILVPISFAWAAFGRIDVLIALYRETPWKKMLMYVVYFMPVLLLAEYSVWSASFNSTSLVVGLCALAQFPALPRFTTSPFLAKSAWCWCCFLLLGALYLPQWNVRQPNCYDISGTVMICMSGFSAFWLSPTRDRLLAVGLTLLMSTAMLVQPLAYSPQHRDGLKYLTFPMMLVPFLALIGKRKMKNRLLHMTFSFGVLVMLTSSQLEPLCYLLSLIFCFLWMLMENFRLSKMLGTNEIRRGIFLAVISHTTVAVTKTIPDSYLHLGFPHMITFYDFYRHTMILSSILAIYITMLPSETHAYSSYVIVLIGDALATLRASIWEIDSTPLHIHGMAFSLAYYLGSLFSTSDVTPDSDDEPDLLKNTIQA